MEFNNYAHFWCAQLVEKLIANGLNHFFIAPGSRGTPIVSAIARNQKANIALGIDERSIGFMALGYGKKNKKAGVVIVTSGTAAANLYPCVTEAYTSRTPLLLLTADRPYELRDCGANQTIFQTNMFSNHVNRSFDLAPPSSTISLEQTLAIIDNARRETTCPRKGPVHINLQLREPLANLPHDEKAFSTSITPSRRNFSFDMPPILEVDMSEIARIIAGKKGFIAVGTLHPGIVQEKILTLASLLDWPIFADILSNLRLARHPKVLPHFELSFLHMAFIDQLSVDMVLKFGAHIVSKRFWSFIEKIPLAKLVSLSDEFCRIDHTGRFENIFVPDLSRAINDLTRTLPSFLGKTSSFFESLKESHQKIETKVDAFLEKKNHNEGYFAARLIATISESVNLFVSSSMPIRDLDQFAKPSSFSIDIYGNRGASGIDGIISTACGIAIADVKKTIVLLGDVAFLHDTNGLMLLRDVKSPMLIVVINNSGSGIFHFLPIAEESDVITPYLDTPHDVSIEHLCRAHHIKHVLIDHPKKFDDAIAQFFIDKTTMVVEVIIDRKENVALHKDFYKNIAATA